MNPQHAFALYAKFAPETRQMNQTKARVTPPHFIKLLTNGERLELSIALDRAHRGQGREPFDRLCATIRARLWPVAA